MSSPTPAPSREQAFSRLFHAVAEKCWPGMPRGAELLDAEARALLAEIGFSEADFFAFIDDYTGMAGDAITWWRKAAEQGSVRAQARLGYFYANGIGVAQDEAEAVRWYRKAAEQGYAEAKASPQRRGK